MGLTPAFLAASWNIQAPYMQPWSVSAIAGCSSSTARLTRSPMRLAPSSSEYSEWQCRWTNDIVAPGASAGGEELRNAKRTNELADTCPPLHLSRVNTLNMLLRHPFGKRTARIRHPGHNLPALTAACPAVARNPPSASRARPHLPELL